MKTMKFDELLTSEDEKLLKERYWELYGASRVRVFILTHVGEKPICQDLDADMATLPPWNFYGCTPILYVAGTKIPIINAQELLEAVSNEGGTLDIGCKTILALDHRVHSLK